MTQQQTPFGRPSGPQFQGPYGQNVGQSSFGGWGGGAPQQWQGNQYPQQQPQFAGPQGQWQQPQTQWGPGQFGPAQQSPQKQRPTGLIIAIVAASLVLAALLGYALLGRGGGSPTDVGPEYQNEDYQVPTAGAEVPDLEMPRSEAEVHEWLDSNPIYGISLGEPVRCELVMDDNVHSMTDDQLQTRLSTFVGCLTRSWGPALEAAGYIAYQPKFTIYTGSVQTQCGTAESFNAFYCGADQNLYLARDILVVLGSETNTERAVYEAIMAHEYGHAMQGRTGLMVAGRILQANEKDEAKALEYGRRVELQADCFSGLALRSLGMSLELTDADIAAIGNISEAIGDDNIQRRFGATEIKVGDHGTGVARRAWAERGIATTDISACDTFAASSSEVN